MSLERGRVGSLGGKGREEGGRGGEKKPWHGQMQRGREPLPARTQGLCPRGGWLTHCIFLQGNEMNEVGSEPLQWFPSLPCTPNVQMVGLSCGPSSTGAVSGRPVVQCHDGGDGSFKVESADRAESAH